MPQGGRSSTVLSFVNCEKYPPSLLYLVMTLGPGLLLLAAFERARGRMAGWLVTFGRVPFFYYVAHIFLIHGLAVAFALATTGDASWLFGGLLAASRRGTASGCRASIRDAGSSSSLLYPLCRWFAALKQRRTEWWLSYL